MPVNPQKGEITIEVGGQRRKFAIGWNELAELEELLGAAVPKLIASNNFGFRAVRATMYVGLAKFDPDITIDAVGDMLGETGNLVYFQEKIGEAMQKSMPRSAKASLKEADEGDDERPLAAVTAAAG